MRTIKTSVGALANLTLQLGVQGDHNSTRFLIDYTEWMEDGVQGAYPSLEILSPAGSVYTAATAIFNENERYTLEWVIDNSDTAECGEGAMRVVLHGSDGSILKSAAAKTLVNPGFTQGKKPDRFDDWLNDLGEMTSQVAGALTETKKLAADAENAKNAAQNFAESAASINEHASFIDTAMDIYVPVDGWQMNGELWEYTIENILITPEVFADINLDDSAELMEAMIEAETGDGILALRTTAKPTGDLNGTAQLCGKIRAYFDDDFKEYLDDKLGSYQPKGNYVTSVNVGLDYTGKTVQMTVNKRMENGDYSGEVNPVLKSSDNALELEKTGDGATGIKLKDFSRSTHGLVPKAYYEGMVLGSEGWENVKTINGEPILGYGNITIESEEVTADSITSALGYTPADDADVTQLKDDIASHDIRITALENNPAVDPSLELRVEKLEAAAEGNLYIFREDAEEAYEKTVPNGALPYATLDSVSGKTVAWNQLSKVTSVNWVPGYGGITLTAVGDGLSFKVSGTCTAAPVAQARTFYLDKGLVTGHKIYFNSKDTRVGLRENNMSQAAFGRRIIAVGSTTGAVIIAAFNGGEEFPDEPVIRPVIVDLTQIFGEGNEPSSVDDERIKWIDAYAEAHPDTVTDGQLVSFEPSAVVSKGRNLFQANFVKNGYNINTDFKFTKVGQYTFSNKKPTQSGNGYAFGFDGTRLPETSYNGFKTDNYHATVNITPKHLNKNLIFMGGDNTSIVEDIEDNIQIEYGSIATEFAPHREPIVYDLSSVTLPTDIAVESGGTLTFESDGTPMPLPSAVTYAVKRDIAKSALTEGADFTEAEKTAARSKLGIVTITQEEYDLLSVKDDGTIYLIVG